MYEGSHRAKQFVFVEFQTMDGDTVRESFRYKLVGEVEKEGKFRMRSQGRSSGCGNDIQFFNQPIKSAHMDTRFDDATIRQKLFQLIKEVSENLSNMSFLRKQLASIRKVG